MKTFIHIIELLLIIYLGFASVYNFIFAIAGIFPIKKCKPKNDIQNRILVLIPGYKEDSVIVETAQKALEQDYPADLYEVIIIADSFSEKTLNALKDVPVKVQEVEFEQSTKSKSLNKVMEDIDENEFEIVVILDADNIMAADFLQQINNAYNAGYQVIQGHRIAKNENTTFAILDGASEEINNHIFRRGHRKLGLSSALIGSGMAFNYKIYKENMVHTMEFAGEDKELELILLRKGMKFHFLPGAFVYDEKIQYAEAFGNQRKRWLAAQFSSFFRYIGPGLAQLITKGNIDFFDKVYQMIQPPRSILLGFPALLFAIYGVIAWFASWHTDLALSWISWLAVLVLTLITLMISLPRRFYNRRTLKALASLPRGIILMIKALLFSKGASRKFIHTQHGVDE